jgi:phosphoribosylamine--glycine ligase
MMTKTGPKLIEFNARFGDPETEVMIPRLKSDLLSVLYAASKGMLDGIKLQWRDKTALGVVMAAEGYPGSYKKNTVIRGLAQAATVPDTTVFHAGTARNADNEVIATGGRVLCVTATAPTIAEAQAKAYEAVTDIDWPEGFYRRDIGWRAVGKAEAA